MIANSREAFSTSVPDRVRANGTSSFPERICDIAMGLILGVITLDDKDDVDVPTLLIANTVKV